MNCVQLFLQCLKANAEASRTEITAASKSETEVIDLLRKLRKYNRSPTSWIKKKKEKENHFNKLRSSWQQAGNKIFNKLQEFQLVI